MTGFPGSAAARPLRGLLCCAAALLLVLSGRLAFGESGAESRSAAFRQGEAAFRAGDYEQAGRRLREVIAAEPAHLQAWELLGWSLIRRQRPGEAVDLWRRLHVLDPDNPYPLNLLARACVAADRLEQAFGYLQRSLELDPAQPDIRYEFGRIGRWLGHFDESIEALSGLLPEHDDSPQIKRELASAYLHSGQYRRALPLFRELAQKNGGGDYADDLARAMLHTGEPEEARRLAEGVLSRDPGDMPALRVLADLHEYGGDPESAVPFLERMLAAASNGELRRALMGRLLELELRLWRVDPVRFSLRRPIELAEDLLLMNPDSVDDRLRLAELLNMDERRERARELFEDVLEHANPNSRRALLGLFELYLAQGVFDRAEEMLQRAGELDPGNPYRHYYRARLSADRGRYGQARRELDALEEAGISGAAAILLYHGLSPSDWGSTLPVSLFRDQLRTLKEAGYRFIPASRLVDYIRLPREVPERLSDASPSRVAVVTFDDGFSSAFELGGPVARELEITFSMHLLPTYIGSSSFFACWDSLLEYRDREEWEFGSHLYHAHDRAPLSPDGIMVYPLANRVWLPDKARLETMEEYRQRLDREYRASRDELRQRLGPAEAVDFVAYPFGEVGHLGYANAAEAIDANLDAAGRYYRAGFIQSRFQYAVQGMNPLLYLRREPRRHQDGRDLLREVAGNHPVFLARRTKAEFAALQGRMYEARDMLALLRRDGYPAEAYAEVEDYVYRHLSGRGDKPAELSDPGRGIPGLIWEDFHSGLSAELFRDSLDSRNLRLTALAGVRFHPRLEATVFGGYGNLQQEYDEVGGGPGRRELSIDESSLGGKLDFTWLPARDRSAPVRLSGEAARRSYSGDAGGGASAYALELAARPLLPLELRTRYEHDSVPAARSVSAGKTHRQLEAAAAWWLRDWWDVNAAFTGTDYSDDNRRRLYSAASMWELWRDIGLRCGLRFSYIDADEDRPDYWSPYKLQRYYAILALRRTVADSYYHLQLRAGVGRAETRPAEEARYREALAESRRNAWAVAPEPPDESWQEVYGASAAARTLVGERFELAAELSHNRSPGYDETRISARVRLLF